METIKYGYKYDRERSVSNNAVVRAKNFLDDLYFTCAKTDKIPGGLYNMARKHNAAAIMKTLVPMGLVRKSGHRVRWVGSRPDTKMAHDAVWLSTAMTKGTRVMPKANDKPIVKTKPSAEPKKQYKPVPLPKPKRVTKPKSNKIRIFPGPWSFTIKKWRFGYEQV